MTGSAKSIFVFGLFLLPGGILLALAPTFCLSLFGFPPPQEVWVRILGIVVAAVGGYYLYCAHHRQTYFFIATVIARPLGAAFYIILPLLDLVSSNLMIFSVIDLLGAGWTYLALKRENLL